MKAPKHRSCLGDCRQQCQKERKLERKLSCFRGAYLVKDACKSSDQVTPLHHHPTGQREGAGVPFLRPTLNPEGQLMGYVVFGISPLHCVVSGLMAKVQPHSETGQSVPGRISPLFLMQLELSIVLLCERGVCVPEAVSLCLVRKSTSCPGGRGMVEGHSPLQGHPALVPHGQPFDWTGQHGMLSGWMLQGSSKGGTPWRGILAGCCCWQCMPYGSHLLWRTGRPPCLKHHYHRLATFEFPPICAI